MAMTVKRRKDARLPKVFMHKIADIRGGVSVKTSGAGGDMLYEGALITKPTDGICSVVKYGVLYADAETTDTSIKLKKGHYFEVGDIIALAGGTSYACAITAIDYSNADYDLVTTGSNKVAKTKITASNCIIKTSTADTSTGATNTAIGEPFAMVGTSKPIITGVNIDTDAWVMGVVKDVAIPAAFSSALKGIVFI